MAKFVVFAKRVDPLEARLRVFCMTDDKEDKTLEYQEHFTEVAKSRDVEVLEGKPQYTELAGNLVPVTKSGEQLQLSFKAFRENRLPFSVRVKDQHADTVGRALFMREPRVAKGEQPQHPICILNIVLPDKIIPDHVSVLTEHRDLITRIDLTQYQQRTISTLDTFNSLANLRIVDISNLLGEDWILLAPEIGVSETEINAIIAENPTSTPRQAQSLLRTYITTNKDGRTLLENGLKTINREDIITKCMRSSISQTITAARKRSSLESEQDMMKDSESVEELAMRERDELKYSAEEKIVEDSDESEEDENVKKSVAQRREQIQKRLSIERPSSQKKEIVQEITEIKRQSLIEDKKALHEEEIIMHAPTDNIIRSTSIPEQIIKLKSNIKESGIDVSKTDFDKELQDKFKTTIKGIEDFEHKTSDDLKSHLQQTLIESSKTKTDSKIFFDSTRTEKIIGTAADDKYADEKVIERTSIFDRSLDNTDSVRKAVTTIESSQPNEYVKTVEETKKKVTESDQATHVDNKLLTERLIERPCETGQTKKFIEHELEATVIDDEQTRNTDTTETTKTSASIIDATRDFIASELTGKPSNRNEYIVQDVVVESAKDATKSGSGATSITVTKETKIEPLIDVTSSSELNKSETVVSEIDDTKAAGKVSKDIFTKATNEDEFFRTIEEKITKKMSQDLTLMKDDIASIGELTMIDEIQSSIFCSQYLLLYSPFCFHSDPRDRRVRNTTTNTQRFPVATE